MENDNFQHITDAYLLVEGALIKSKTQEEIFQVGAYDADKKGYIVYPYEDGEPFNDFGIVITESELMDNYFIETDKQEPGSPTAGN